MTIRSISPFCGHFEFLEPSINEKHIAELALRIVEQEAEGRLSPKEENDA